MFEKSNLKITEDRIVSIFFPLLIEDKIEPQERTAMNMNMNNSNDKIIINNDSDNSIKVIEDNHNIKGYVDGFNINNDASLNLPSATSCIHHFIPASQLKLINNSPKKSLQYKIKQFVNEDFV